jgi:hypothetical protein
MKTHMAWKCIPTYVTYNRISQACVFQCLTKPDEHAKAFSYKSYIYEFVTNTCSGMVIEICLG